MSIDETPAGRIRALIADIDRIRAQQPEHMRTLPVAPTLDGNTRHGARVDDLHAILADIEAAAMRNTELLAAFNTLEKHWTELSLQYGSARRDAEIAERRNDSVKVLAASIVTAARSQLAEDFGSIPFKNLDFLARQLAAALGVKVPGPVPSAPRPLVYICCTGTDCDAQTPIYEGESAVHFESVGWHWCERTVLEPSMLKWICPACFVDHSCPAAVADTEAARP
jgi:hypothetical protein